MKDTIVNTIKLDKATLLNGDCLEVLKTIDDNSVDSVVTDPPAGISFMQAEWDGDKGGRDEWIAWLSDVMRECRRVLKPGGHALVWAIPRTSHWTSMAIENAGFQIRDVVTHVFGSGFPKSHNVSMAIDREAGAEREVIGTRTKNTAITTSGGAANFHPKLANEEIRYGDVEIPITAPATENAKKWEGWGTALKPASEHWILARKPLEASTVAQNVVRFGAGALNIDGSRVGTDRVVIQGGGGGEGTGWGKKEAINEERVGRFPSNFMLSHSPHCALLGKKQSKGVAKAAGSTGFGEGRDDKYVKGTGLQFTPDVWEEVWQCAPGCPISVLNEQSGEVSFGNKDGGYSYDKSFEADGFLKNVKPKAPSNYGDSGGASRFFKTFDAPFFYCSKPSSAEKNAETVNSHPTVKSIKLMEYLIRLVTQPDGIVLDPFMGSGTTGVAAVINGWHFVGIEREPEFFNIASARISKRENPNRPEPQKIIEPTVDNKSWWEG